MAWPKDLRQVIDLLEDGMASMNRARGYLEAKSKNDAIAGSIASDLNAAQTLWRTIRMQQWQQLGLFQDDEVKGKD